MFSLNGGKVKYKNHVYILYVTELTTFMKQVFVYIYSIIVLFDLSTVGTTGPTVHFSFSLVEDRDRRTADAISVTSQSQPFRNYQQSMACFVLYV